MLALRRVIEIRSRCWSLARLHRMACVGAASHYNDAKCRAFDHETAAMFEQAMTKANRSERP